VQELQAALTEDAHVIQRFAGVPTAVQTADEGDTAPEFAAKILQLPAPAAAIYVTRTDLSRARAPCNTSWNRRVGRQCSPTRTPPRSH
jgi:hypothetical protein